MREIRDPYGMLFLTGFISSWVLSRYITVSVREEVCCLLYYFKRDTVFFHLAEKMFMVDKVKIIFDVKS